MKRGLSGVLVLIGGASFGMLATFVNLGYAEGYTVGELTGSQMFFGALFLWIVAFLRRKTWTAINVKTVLLLMLAGTLNGMTGIFYYSSMQSIPASIAIVLLFQFVWVGMLYAWIFDGQKPTKNMVLSLIMILIGTLLAANVFQEGLQGFSPLGLFFGFLSAFTFAGFIYVSGKLATNVTPWLRSPIMLSGAALLIFILFPPSFFVSGALAEGLWKFALPLAFFVSVPTVCFTLGAPQLKGGVATILSSVELPVAVLMAWLVLKECVGFWQWIGVCLILLAITIGELQAMRTSQLSSEQQ